MTVGEFETGLFLATQTVLILLVAARRHSRRWRHYRHPSAASLRALERAHRRTVRSQL